MRMFISVDLPAPFLPTRAWISPRRTSKETPSSARTPGNVLTDVGHLDDVLAVDLCPSLPTPSSVVGGAPRCCGAPLRTVVHPKTDGCRCRLLATRPPRQPRRCPTGADRRRCLAPTDVVDRNSCGPISLSSMRAGDHRAPSCSMICGTRSCLAHQLLLDEVRSDDTEVGDGLVRGLVGVTITDGIERLQAGVHAGQDRCGLPRRA